MSCAAQVFSNVSSGQMAAIRAKAAAAGLDLTGDSGTVHHSGVTLDWAYDGSALTLTCTGKPFFISCDHVNGSLHDLIENCLKGES